MSIDDLKLRTKSMLPVAFVAVTIVIMVVFNAMQLTTISETASEVIEHRDAAIIKLVRAARVITLAPYSVFETLMFDSDSPAGRAADKGYPKAVSEAAGLLDEAIALAPDKSAQIGQFKGRFEGLVAELARPLKIGQDTPGLDKGSKLAAGDLDQMAQAAVLMNAIDMKMRALIDDFVTFNNAFMAENVQAAAGLRATASTSLMTMVAGGVAALVLAGAFSIWISTSKIAAPLGKLASAMRSLAQGDLSVAIGGQTRRDEIGDMGKAVQVFKDNAVERARLEADLATQRLAAEAEAARVAQERASVAMEQAEVVRKLGTGLKAAASGDLTVRLDEGFTAAYTQIKDDFNAAIAQLRDAMLAVTTSANTIRSGTQEIAAASNDLARRTEQQASSLEETAAALDEITATVKKSADGAKTASEVAVAADNNAKESADVVRNATDAMGAIAKSSQQISQIIGVIDEIAFQTNLLALNAGVEAARAGDAGRGFAVVASEVRALAQRSAEAAKQIKGLITSSSAQVDRGVKLVVEAGRSLERITAQVTEINVIVGEIALGTREQATGLQQVNIAVNQMDQATQQNAAMVEESTAASQSLSEETVQLATLVARFRVGPSGDAAGRDERSVRRELQRVVPHAFGRPSPSEGAARRNHAVRPRSKAAIANGTTGAGTDVAGWEEF